MANVVQEHRRADEGRVLLEERERAAGEVIGAEGVLEAGMGRARVDQVGEAELPDVAQALHGIRVEQSQRERLDTDVIPERIPDDLDVRGLYSPEYAGTVAEGEMTSVMYMPLAAWPGMPQAMK